jgi:hypothetical protein
VFIGTVAGVTSPIEVVNSLFGKPGGPRHARSMEVIGDGAVHVEYPEDDHVYLVTVRQIPRIVLPLQGPLMVGARAGVPVQLVRIAVANHVEVTLDATPGPERDATLADFEQRYRQWEQGDSRNRQPPAWPAEQFSAIPIAISDDLGTAYHRQSVEAGGHGTEFRSRWKFLPAAPELATRLTVRLTPSEGAPVEVELPLPNASD